MYLLDTNILLEILLGQEKSDQCEHFLNSNLGRLTISDFSLHSIGVILYRNKRQDVFYMFASEVLERIPVYNLPVDMYTSIFDYSRITGLDFDDTYQCLIAKSFDLKIVTMDKDFIKAIDVQVDYL
ncbi:MAG: PIN domain-containing protein [Bacillota bacterium]